MTVTYLGGGEALLDDGTYLRAPRLVNALGADAASCTGGLPVKKRKGHLAITDRYPGFVNHQLVELGYLKSAHSISRDSVAFNVQPRLTGQVLIGSSRQYGNEDPAVNHGMFSAMLQRATLYMPAIGSLSVIRVWTGFRMATSTSCRSSAQCLMIRPYGWRPATKDWASRRLWRLRNCWLLRSRIGHRRLPRSLICRVALGRLKVVK